MKKLSRTMSSDTKGSASGRPRVVIVQPYVPAYRVVFFSRLIDSLAQKGVDCVVAAAQPKGDQRARGDNAEEAWMVPYTQRYITIFGRTIGLGGARKTWANADIVVIGHLGSSLDTYLALLDAKLGRVRVGLWGHIKDYVNKGVAVDVSLEKWQLRNADHVFAYMPSGRRYAIAHGVPPEKVTAVMNTVDTSRLADAISTLDEKRVAEFVTKHHLVPGRILGYIGGMDASKRVDFLATALDSLWDTDPDLKVLVGGQGAHSVFLDAAVARGQVVQMGFVGAEDQALIGKLAVALLMPGRVGLVAVDALMLNVPIITTDWPFHAPEIEYLTEGLSKFTSQDKPESYASTVRSLLNNSDVLAASETPSEETLPSIENMVNNFATGIIQLVHQRCNGASAN